MVLPFSAEHHNNGTESGPFQALNPTSRILPFHVNKAAQSTKFENEKQQVKSGNDISIVNENLLHDAGPEEKTRASSGRRQWRTRDNRKGRHAILVKPDEQGKYLTPPRTNSLKEVLRGIIRMFTRFPVWDVSYLVAVIFTLGSVIWCINAFFVWLPLEDPSTEFSGEIADAGGITAFIGATIFEIGSILLMIEAVNENRSDCFGWALEEVLEEQAMVRVKPGHCTHHHQNKRNFVGNGRPHPLGSEHESHLRDPSSSARSWTWFPTWQELTTHYLRDIGFLACSFQMAGATIFWISGFTALPPIYSRFHSIAAQNGAYWLPQVLGGSGFIISGTLFMLETQRRWYMPAFRVLGWHIGAWNLVGGIGFTLCGALGFAASNSGAVYQGSLATFWGSWAFLIGSVVQWFESLDKHPVDVPDGSKKEGGKEKVGS